jgi:hypothetical protein
VIAAIRANAELVVKQSRAISGIDFGYTRDSVEWLEGHIERLRESGQFDGARKDMLVSVFGSFLGECIIRCHGGSWKQRDGTWCVAFGDEDQHTAFPFTKVQKQFDNGLERGDGILGFFTAIPSIWPSPAKQT